MDENQIKICTKWIKKFVIPAKKINDSFMSYKLKHLVESYGAEMGDRPYVSNEAFIEAARRLGYKSKPISSSSINFYFNMDFTKWKERNLPEAAKKKNWVFKKWMDKQRKKGFFPDGPNLDFVEDALRDNNFIEPKNWDDLKTYLEKCNAIPAAVKAAKRVFNIWQENDPKARVDGMGAKDIANLRRVTRQVWSWSYPKKLCIERATQADGFVHCNKCKKKVPKIFVDHIVPVGDLDGGYFERLYCSSKGLQALCKPCHDSKTRSERKKPLFTDCY
jgi:hypothetical protein